MIGALFNTEGVSRLISHDPGEVTELVRGNEQLLLDHLIPVVREQSVTLDLSKVTRIDAAGLAALIQLYCAARDAGHSFAVTHPTERVAELLALVRLDGLLVLKSADSFACAHFNLQETAA